jgi:predicted nucleotide-binding protein (sugar kinase/HSP70/actin superfamily)
LLRWTYGRMRGALGNVPHELPRQSLLRDLAKPYYHSRLNGGEGDMLVGKALWAHQNRKAHMICELSPYSCMPNTMSIGAMAAVLGRHPDLLYAPLEIKGDAEVHALSRCQMILTEAKKRAQKEHDEVLARTGLTLDQLRERETPQMRRATYRVPHHGAAGTAANYALHLAQC